MRKELALFSTPLIYLLAITAFIAVPVMVKQNESPEVTRQEYPRIYPEKCMEVLRTHLGGIKPIYSTVCYVKDGVFIGPVIHDSSDTAFIARVEAAKDSLRRKYMEGW